MQLIISGRHVALAESLREHMEERFNRLARFDENVSRIEVTLSEEKKRCMVEANVSVRRGTGIHARNTQCGAYFERLVACAAAGGARDGARLRSFYRRRRTTRLPDTIPG